MSALGHKRTFCDARAMSALHPKICGALVRVRFVPIADIASLIRSPRRHGKRCSNPEDAHFNNMSTFATDEHLRQDDDLDIPV